MKVLITGADRGLGFGMAKLMLQNGNIVFAGQYLPEWGELGELLAHYPDRLFILPLDVASDDSVAAAAKMLGGLTDSLDILINNAGISGNKPENIGLHMDKQGMMDAYNVNALGAARTVEAFYPFLEKGNTKKLCFVSSEAGSITRSERDFLFGYCMSKAALNMYVKILFNQLHPKGYKFRLYYPGWIKSYMGGKLSERGDLTIDEAAAYANDFFVNKQIDEDSLFMYGFDGEKFEF